MKRSKIKEDFADFTMRDAAGKLLELATKVREPDLILKYYTILIRDSL